MTRNTTRSNSQETRPASSNPQRVAICVITCRRPDGLARLLVSLDAQEIDHEQTKIEVVVVDNDIHGSARDQCERHHARWPVSWYHEPRPGIPFARNTAVTRAGNVDWVVFVDDDEVPQPGWLAELLRVQQSWKADVVTGPVLFELGTHPPPWAPPFFVPVRQPTGSVVDNAYTGNLLVRKSLLTRLGTPFNERMALMGGSDIYLSRRLQRVGARMVWADNAIVTETVPPERQRVGWLGRRAFRTGVSRAFTENDFAPSFFDRARLVARGSFRAAGSTFRLPWACLAGKTRVIQRLRAVCYGAGLVAGTLGYQYNEYQTAHRR